MFRNFHRYAGNGEEIARRSLKESLRDPYFMRGNLGKRRDSWERGLGIANLAANQVTRANHSW